jgi:hypothetical protein
MPERRQWYPADNDLRRLGRAMVRLGVVSCDASEWHTVHCGVSAQRIAAHRFLPRHAVAVTFGAP